MKVLSLNIGRVISQKNVRGKLAKSGIAKSPVDGPAKLERSGFVGDESAYRSRSTGDTAVHAFCSESYSALSLRLAASRTSPLPIPCFGENLTIEGYPESDVRIGDVLRIGSATLHVNQPVVRCSWPGVIAGEKRLLKLLRESLLTGFYLDVLESGWIVRGDVIQLIARGGDPTMTVLNLNRTLLAGTEDEAWLSRLRDSSDLSPRWKSELFSVG